MKLSTIWRLKIAIVIVFSFFCYLAYFQWNNTEILKEQKKDAKTSSVEYKFDVIKSVLIENYKRAKLNSDIISRDLIKKIKDKYTNKEISVYLDQISDLNNHNKDENNPIIKESDSELSKEYLVFNGIKDDLNIPMISTYSTIITDFSNKNTEESSKIKYLMDEAKTYSDSYLSNIAFSRIVSFKELQMISGGLNDIIFWDYRLKPHKITEYPSEQSMDIDFLKRVFIKNDGNLDSLKYFIFAYPEYVYAKKDLADRPSIDDRGYSRLSYSTPIVVIQRFSLYDSIINNITESQALTDISYSSDKKISEIDVYLFWETFSLYTTGFIFLLMQFFVAHIVHIETKKIIEEDDNGVSEV